MKHKLLGLAACGLALAAFILAVVPARAQTVDEKIQALEAQLNSLKAEQAKTQTEQLELRKEATAAAAALPNFTYRPGDGVWIEAADRSWSLNLTYEVEMASYNLPKGNAHLGAPNGDIFWRRNRPYLRTCLADCFYDYTIGWDMDTGDMVNPNVRVCTTNTGNCSPTNIRPNRAALQTQAFSIHFEKINPWFPTFQIGDNIGSYSHAVGFPGIKTGNQNVSADEQITDMLSDSDANELGRRAIQLGWIGKPLGPGDFTFALEYKPGVSVGDANTATLNTATTDRAAFQTALQYRPMSRSKNPWLERTAYAIGVQTDTIDPRDQGNRGLSQTTFEREGRLTVFSTGSNVGSGNHVRFEQAFTWGYGPYWLTMEHGLTNYQSGSGNRTHSAGSGARDCCLGIHGYYWGITHDFWLWGRKGFLTGQRGTAGSVLLGWGFKRSFADCERTNCASGGGFSSNALTARTLGLFYVLWRGARMGVQWNWYTTANTPVAVQNESGCGNGTNRGKSCDIQAISLILHTNF
jgi:hypothetical protein